ncbi:DNA cytosine methyltransferase [Vampirovibrio sp.]|uniref:DNA cytosine methyltransferase n=1 Tax=Vampirovibrio sp. TaxID=2717857 RepID=UPI003593415A
MPDARHSGPFRWFPPFAGREALRSAIKMAGGRVLLAIEWEQNAVETYGLNHPDTTLLHRDIATVSAAEILSLTGSCKP